MYAKTLERAKLLERIATAAAIGNASEDLPSISHWAIIENNLRDSSDLTPAEKREILAHMARLQELYERQPEAKEKAVRDWV